jgi:hypothetical protein
MHVLGYRRLTNRYAEVYVLYYSFKTGKVRKH